MQNDDEVFSVMISEWDEIREKHAVPRRSKILKDPKAAMDLTEEDLLANDRSIVVVTAAGYIKRMPVSDFHAQRRGTRGKAGARQRGHDDDAVTQFFTCNDHDTVLFATTSGIVHSIRAFQVPLASRTARGTPLPAVLPLGAEDSVAGVVPVTSADLQDDNQFLVLVSKRGWIKKTLLSAFATTSSRGLIAQVLDDGDRLLSARRCSNEDSVVVATVGGFVTRFDADQKQLRATGRSARGVKSLTLREGDMIADLDILPPSAADDSEDAPSSLLVVTKNGFGKRVLASEFRSCNRGGKGVTAIKFKKGGDEEDCIACCKVVDDGDEVMLTTSKGTIVRQRGDDIARQGRTATGVRVQKLDDGDAILEVAVVPNEEDVEEPAAPEPATVA
mmetsp:Transcript_8234/g.23470  ORF Transcript_8234/g.23470 Transcript_8234/m.23470 type:complete len:389 (-) Transcript_8234:88-1254(-)